MKFEDGKIGMKVRCVDPGFYLTKGVIYTIYSLKEVGNDKRFILEEFDEDYLFNPYRFEPVPAVKTVEISMNTAEAIAIYYITFKKHCNYLYKDTRNLLSSIENDASIMKVIESMTDMRTLHERVMEVY